MTPAEFKTRFPQFAAVPDARVQFFIEDAAPFFDVDRWAKFYTVGLANYVAHNLVMDAYGVQLGGGAGAAKLEATQKRVGDVSVTYSTGMVDAAAKDPQMRTIYGQEYLRLRRMVGMGGAVT